MALDTSSGLVFAQQVSQNDQVSQTIEAFQLEKFIEQPKGKTRIFDLLVEELKTRPLVGQLIQEFNEISTDSFNMLNQETISQLFKEFSEAVEESESMTVD